MSDGQTKNAALTTALAFHYQMLIGLNKCFSLENGQSVWFEKDGDVSLLALDAAQSTQTEVKDYTDICWALVSACSSNLKKILRLPRILNLSGGDHA